MMLPTYHHTGKYAPPGDLSSGAILCSNYNRWDLLTPSKLHCHLISAKIAVKYLLACSVEKNIINSSVSHKIYELNDSDSINA